MRVILTAIVCDSVCLCVCLCLFLSVFCVCVSVYVFVYLCVCVFVTVLSSNRPSAYKCHTPNKKSKHDLNSKQKI